MSSMNPELQAPRDAELVLRDNDGTAVSADVTYWLDTGTNAPLGNGTSEAVKRRFDLILDFEDLDSDDGADADTITVTVSMTNTAGATAGEGSIQATDPVIVCRTYDNDDDTAGVYARDVIPLTNYYLGTTYQYVQIVVAFNAAAAAKWGGFLAHC